MKSLLIAIGVLALSACASAPSPQAPYTPGGAAPVVVTATQQGSDLNAARDRLTVKRQALQDAKDRAEIARLEDEIAGLEQRIAELERQLAQPAATNTPGGYSSGPVFTGPRGGKYTISPSGKKQYIKRK